MNEKDLEDLFEEFGVISSSRIITDKFNGRSKGFGFITMENQAEASKAIKELDGSTLDNRKIVVNEAKPKRDNY